MLHLIMTLLIYGVDTESANCPETCKCVETVISDMSNAATGFDVMNLNDSSSLYKGVLNGFSQNDIELNSEVMSDDRRVFGNYSQPKKCAKNIKETVRDIFMHNFSTKSVKPKESSFPKDIRTKRTIKVSGNETENVTKEVVNQKNARNKEISTYQITCNGIRDVKPLWVRYLPNPTTQLNIRGAFFQSFKAFQQILKESPTKLSHLTVLSLSDSVINQKPDKKYSLETDKERTSDVGSEENKHSEFLPFASLQNPKLRSKSDLEFTSKGKCKNLQVLNLANNTITYLPRDTFHPFLNLQVLNLSNNLMQFIDNEMFSPLINLLQLDIHNNRLLSLNEIMFKNLTKLLFLDVSQNLISNIAPSTFQYLISLNVLNLARNPLSEKQEAMILLGTGKRLQIVDISKTGLKQIPGTLERSVRVLNLMGNHLLSIRCGDLDSYSLLSYLNLRSNKISYVEDDALGRLEFLNNLQISENNLFQIPKSLPNNLEILNLSYNNIQNITNLDFLNLSFLKELSLSYNQVSNIEGNAFNNLVHLKVLDLSRNPILILPNIYNKVKLTVLNLSYFTNIPGSYSTRYRQFPVESPETVQYLNLESSPVLTKVFLQDTKTLASFSSLEELNLRFTNLTTIRKDIFDRLTKLKILKVEGNPWHCGREILMLSNWLKTHENEKTTQDEDEVNTAHCSTPSNLYKTTLITLEEKDFENAQNNKNDRSTDLHKEDEVAVAESGTPGGTFIQSKNISGEVDIPKVKKVNFKKYNKSSGGVKTSLQSKNESCCGKPEEKIEERRRSSWKNSTDTYLLSNKRISAGESLNGTTTEGQSFATWNDNSTNFDAEMKHLGEFKSSRMSSKAEAKKAEAVTANDTLSLKKEYNSHLSFLILSSIGLVIMATLTFTSVYFSRTRRDQSYQRQNQDIEVCSISSLGNELW